ncbi:T9SS type A sorting domain-containing protein, partial [candidate division WOR-3 bacterium]|nr:T9SS type A sorting domain-containing protein [candidate division WOR-3 bacterium]
NSWMDHISPTGTGFLVFVDGNNAYDCGVANDAGTYQTVGTSFELGALTDAGGVSTRAALLDSIMHFFGIFVVGINEHANEPVGVTTIHCTPNPCVHSMKIDFQSPAGDNARIRIYDAAGRVVKEYPRLGALDRTVMWYGEDNAGRSVPCGVYFVHIDSSHGSAVEKVVLLE